MLSLNPETRILRIDQALTETKRLLSKALSYMEHNQKQDVIKSYKLHILKLENMKNDAMDELENKIISRY